MRILVDADSMPVRVREIVAGHAARSGMESWFVSHQPIPLPNSPGVVADLADDADDRIVDLAQSDDIVVTHDIPLAARVTDRGAVVITDRGERYTRENVRQRLSSRDFAMEMREAGVLQQRSRPYGRREIQAFSNALDRELANRRGRR